MLVLCVTGEQDEDWYFTWGNSLCTLPQQISHRFQRKKSDVVDSDLWFNESWEYSSKISLSYKEM